MAVVDGEAGVAKGVIQTSYPVRQSDEAIDHVLAVGSFEGLVMKD